MTSNDDIMRALGRLEEGVKRIREDFQDEKESAHESRATIHKRLDEHTSKMGHLETTVAVAGKVDAQLRDQIITLEKTVAANHIAVQPALEDWGRVKFIGWGVGFVILSLGISAASIYAWAWEWAKSMARWITGH